MNVSPTTGRVLRPLGMTLAILSAVIMFSFIPLIEFYLAWRLNANETDENFIINSAPYDIWVQLTGALAVIVLVASVFAWLGRPKYIRLVFLSSIGLSLVLAFVKVLVRGFGTEQDPVFGISSPGVLDVLCGVQLAPQILTALYILWYANRAPARAFYTQTPLLTLEEKRKQSS